MADADENRELLIKRYFSCGYTYKEILMYLEQMHGISLSYRHLKRILKYLCLGRRQSSSLPFSVIYKAVKSEIDASSGHLGYRALHQQLICQHNINISRKLVNELQRLLDPDGVEGRRKGKLKRRKYQCRGPNDVWHIDGYDKLKKFGFCVHGCIDGYSRKLLWLEVANSNNDPAIIAGYYLSYVKKICGTARRIRSDNGTENGNVAAIQRYFRSNNTDSFSGDKSFIFGSSHTNQRIEAWWTLLRKWKSQWWMNYFKDLQDDGTWDETDMLHRECLQFCFHEVIQKELNDIRRIYNTHRIRPYPNQMCPSGKPNIIYHLPRAYGTRDFATEVASTDLKIAKEHWSRPKTLFGCSVEFESLAFALLLLEHDLQYPSNASEALALFTDLIALIEAVERT